MSLFTYREPKVVQKIQVFLREDQKAGLKSLAAQTGARQSDLVRQGVDLLLEGAARQATDWREETRLAAGLWRDHEGVAAAVQELRESVKKRFRAVYDW